MKCLVDHHFIYQEGAALESMLNGEVKSKQKPLAGDENFIVQKHALEQKMTNTLAMGNHASKN